MKAYKCSICGFQYEEEKWAKACENFCKEHSSCSLEITRHAIENRAT